MSDAQSTGAESGSLVQVRNSVRLDESQFELRLHGIVQQRQDATTSNAQGQFVMATSPRQRRGQNSRGTPLADASTYQERYAIKCYLAQAEQATKDLVELAAAHDAVELTLGIKRLREVLQQLWKLRKAREDEWAEVLNFVQGALRQADTEQFTAAQASAIRAVIRNHLALGATLDHQPRQVRTILREVGLDPWGPLQLHEVTGNGHAGE